MSTPRALSLDFSVLAPATHAGRLLAARLVALLATLGLTAHEGLPHAALRRATTDGTPEDHMRPGVYVHATGDGALVVWASARHGVHAGPGRGPAHVDAQDLLQGLVVTLESVGTVGPLPDRLDAPDTFRPSYRVTWPDDSDALAVLVEDLDEDAGQ